MALRDDQSELNE
jgi:hypothetical protein